MSFVIYNVIEYFQCHVIEHQDNTIAFDVWKRRMPLILKFIILTCKTEDP